MTNIKEDYIQNNTKLETVHNNFDKDFPKLFSGINIFISINALLLHAILKANYFSSCMSSTIVIQILVCADYDGL